jgi:GT2 family glycosyltransferase
MNEPRVSILIVNWNTSELMSRCLDSLPERVGAYSVETVVVDNGSKDGSAGVLKRRTDIDLTLNDANVGYAAAVNQAYRRSTGHLVLLLNSDVEFLPGALEALVDFLDGRPDIAGAAPLYVNPDRSPQPFHFRFPTFTVTLANGSSLVRRLPGMERRLRHFRMLDEDFSQPRPVPQPSASCLLLRRKVLPQDHVFDERYPIFFNDVQLARGLAADGHELWVTPAAVVVHEAHASTRKLGARLKRHYVGSLVRMLRETEPLYLTCGYAALVFAQGLVSWGLGRPDALRPRDLLDAVLGDPGPLPQAPAR